VPRYCKIDIEGNDLLALRSLAGLAEFPSFISLESEKRSWDRLVQELIWPHRFGYRQFKAVNQALVPLQSSPAEPREGVACDYAFQVGSSGLFGEELPRRWVDVFEIAEAYKANFHGYHMTGDQGVRRGDPSLPAADWYDTHAGR
jgi:hypothetical protein